MSDEIDKLFARLKVLDTPLNVRRTEEEQTEVKTILSRLRELNYQYPYLFDGSEKE